jgi:hypothetical protein
VQGQTVQAAWSSTGGTVLAQIGKRLGITRQRVQKALALQGKHPSPHRGQQQFPVYCVGCLPRDATFGQRLKTRRLSAGLTLAALEKRSGVGHVLLYECGRSEPAWQSVARLIRVLGVEWLAVE